MKYEFELFEGFQHFQWLGWAFLGLFGLEKEEGKEEGEEEEVLVSSVSSLEIPLVQVLLVGVLIFGPFRPVFCLFVLFTRSIAASMS